MKILICFAVSIILFAGCEVKPDLEYRLSKTNISTPINYKILKYDYGWALGESSETYKLVIDTTDYQKIVNDIKMKPFFENIGGSKKYPSAYPYHSNMDKIDEVAYEYDDSVYCYEIFSPDPAIVISVDLKNDSLMTVYYDDL